ncbi:DUF6020 family protein [Streptomyces showdoensis]|uniref:Glycosyltransferase RgtA/B/C/D-like domain-containing protein n=1 Tax=Streptomyces showdoensis TaxID=68268 RepID=A0A2P2GVJ2_STREW|nr:DUF6020 family protein [Streptomyces showdoensis]KKZ75512.1 hypothetical protein VO63_01405 [Streptomyces showdoensis]
MNRIVERIPAQRRLPLAVYAATQLIFLVWWAAFYPGGMSYDSISYVWHVTTGHWMSNHSVAYDGLVWLSLQLTGDLALLTFAQSVAMAAALAYVVVTLRMFGVKGKWSFTAAVACAVLPSIGTFVIYVWKDVPFAIGAVVAFGAAGRLAARRLRGESQLRDKAFRNEIVMLFIGFLAMGLFRNNGLLVAVIAVPVLLLTLPKMRKWLLFATVVPVTIAALLQTVIYPAIGVITPTKDQVYAMNYADIAVVYGKVPQTFTQADKDLMAKVAPLSHWGGRAANCYNADWAMKKPMNRKLADQYNDQLIDLWFRVLKRTPDQMIAARVCRSHIAWSPFPGPVDKMGHTLISPPSVPKNLFGWADWNPEMADSPYRPILKIRPLNDQLHDAAFFAWKASKTPQLQWLLFRGAIWCYAAYAVVLAFSRRNRTWAPVALLSIPLALQLTVVAANPAPLARYMFAPMFLGILTLPLIGAKPRFGKGSKPQPEQQEPKKETATPDPEPEPEPVA